MSEGSVQPRLWRVNLDDTGITLADIMARGPKDANTGDPVSADDLRSGRWQGKGKLECGIHIQAE